MKQKQSPKFKLIVMILGILMALLLTISFFLDDQIKISHSIVIKSSPEKVFTNLIDLKQWEEWSVWNRDYYRNKKVTYILDPQGRAQKQMIYQNQTIQKTNHLEMEIEISVIQQNRKIEMLYHLNGFDTTTQSTFLIHPQPQGVVVKWYYQGDYRQTIGFNPLRKYFLFFTRSSLDQANQDSLEGLRKYLEESPPASRNSSLQLQ